MTALLTLAKSLGIDPGPLNQADLQEQTCSKALTEIQHWHDQMDKTCEEGCTPADAEKLKGFNEQLAFENFALKNERDSLAAKVERLRDVLANFYDYVHCERMSTDGAVIYSTSTINHHAFMALNAINETKPDHVAEPWNAGCGMAPDGGYECNCGQCE